MSVTGLVGHPMELTQPTMKVVDPQQEQQVHLKPLHPSTQALVSSYTHDADIFGENGNTIDRL